MANALKLITCSLIGTLLAIAITGVVIEDWVDHKINEVSVMVDYKINNVLTTPARAALTSCLNASASMHKSYQNKQNCAPAILKKNGQLRP